MVRGDARLEPFEPLVISQGRELVVLELLDVVLGDHADARALGAAHEPHAIAQQLADGIVTGGSREDEGDRRQHLEVLEHQEHVGAPR